MSAYITSACVCSTHFGCIRAVCATSTILCSTVKFWHRFLQTMCWACFDRSMCKTGFGLYTPVITSEQLNLLQLQRNQWRRCSEGPSSEIIGEVAEVAVLRIHLPCREAASCPASYRTHSQLLDASKLFKQARCMPGWEQCSGWIQALRIAAVETKRHLVVSSHRRRGRRRHHAKAVIPRDGRRRRPHSTRGSRRRGNFLHCSRPER